MARAAIDGDALFDASDWEIQQSGVGYSIRTVRHFLEAAPSLGRLGWLIGMDTLAQLHTWREIGALAGMCAFVTAGRPGAAAPDFDELSRLCDAAVIERMRTHVLSTPLIDISATEVRRRVAMGLSIRYLVPTCVDAYIRTHGLYASPSDADPRGESSSSEIS
jgi:nicotinate-nucleotide adenylyltransferase